MPRTCCWPLLVLVAASARIQLDFPRRLRPACASALCAGATNRALFRPSCETHRPQDILDDHSNNAAGTDASGNPILKDIGWVGACVCWGAYHVACLHNAARGGRVLAVGGTPTAACRVGMTVCTQIDELVGGCVEA